MLGWVELWFSWGFDKNATQELQIRHEFQCFFLSVYVLNHVAHVFISRGWCLVPRNCYLNPVFVLEFPVSEESWIRTKVQVLSDISQSQMAWQLLANIFLWLCSRLSRKTKHLTEDNIEKNRIDVIHYFYVKQ